MQAPTQARTKLTLGAIFVDLQLSQQPSPEFAEIMQQVMATEDMPLLRMWENAVMSMQSPPLTSSIDLETEQQNGFKLALLHTLASITNNHSLFSDLLPNTYSSHDIKNIDFSDKKERNYVIR